MAALHKNARLEAFSDGVFAIALTLLILDIRLPSSQHFASSSELWQALYGLKAAIFAFLLSFAIIFITWVNHHATMEQVIGSSTSFMYANAFLLLTVVFLPFPAALLGDVIGTNHAAPAVVLYNSVLAIQAIAWIAVKSTALNDRLAANESAIAVMRENRRHGYVALVLYSVLALAAFWFPLAVAIVTTLSWILWLVLGIRMSRAV